MSVTTDLYVRYSLPLAQAREAMATKGVKVGAWARGQVLKGGGVHGSNTKAVR